MRGFLGFAICFAVLMWIWWAHHTFFRRYALTDGYTIVINTMLLFLVLYYTYPLKFPTLTATIPSTGQNVADTRVESNNIRFHNCTFLGSISGYRPIEYTHWRNKVQMTGETRFYLDPNDLDLATQSDANAIKAILNAMSPPDVQEMAKSSVLMPGWSFDVGSFTSDRAIVTRCLAPRAADRYANAGEIAADLVRYRGGQAVAAHPETVFDRAGRFFTTYRTFILIVAAYIVMRAIVAYIRR